MDTFNKPPRTYNLDLPASLPTSIPNLPTFIPDLNTPNPGFPDLPADFPTSLPTNIPLLPMIRSRHEMDVESDCQSSTSDDDYSSDERTGMDGMESMESMDQSMHSLQWELTIPEHLMERQRSLSMNSEDHGLYYMDGSDRSSFSLLSNLTSPFNKNGSSDDDDQADDEEKSRILDQFEDHQYTSNLARVVVDGFIRDSSQMEGDYDSMCVPKELNEIMFGFYYQESMMYFHFGYRLHQKLGAGLMRARSGDSLLNMVRENVADVFESSISGFDAVSVCDGLLKHDCIELTSFRASFFSLFDEPDANDCGEDKFAKYRADDHTFYVFSVDMIDQFRNHKLDSYLA